MAKAGSVRDVRYSIWVTKKKSKGARIRLELQRRGKRLQGIIFEINIHKNLRRRKDSLKGVNIREK